MDYFRSGLAYFSAGSLTLFSISSHVYCLAFTFIEAVATKRIPSLVYRIVILGIFVHAGLVSWTYGIPLFVGYGVGGYLGATTAVTMGNQWLRILLVFIVCASAIKLVLL